MNKLKILLLFFLLASIAGFSQTVINSSNYLAQVNEQVLFKLNIPKPPQNPPYYLLPTTGANQIWNYTNAIEQGVLDSFSYLSIPSNSPFTNIASIRRTDLKFDFLNGQVLPYEVFYSKTTAALVEIGYSTPLDSVSSGNIFKAVFLQNTFNNVDPDTLISFPIDTAYPFRTQRYVRAFEMLATNNASVCDTPAPFPLTRDTLQLEYTFIKTDSMAGWGNVSIPLTGISYPAILIKHYTQRFDTLKYQGAILDTTCASALQYKELLPGRNLNQVDWSFYTPGEASPILTIRQDFDFYKTDANKCIFYTPSFRTTNLKPAISSDDLKVFYDDFYIPHIRSSKNLNDLNIQLIAINGKVLKKERLNISNNQTIRLTAPNSTNKLNLIRITDSSGKLLVNQWVEF